MTARVVEEVALRDGEARDGNRSRLAKAENIGAGASSDGRQEEIERFGGGALSSVGGRLIRLDDVGTAFGFHPLATREGNSNIHVSS
jgi:hypothetical protein